MCLKRAISTDCKLININKSTWRLFELPVAAHLLAAFRRHDGNRLGDIIQVRQEDANSTKREVSGLMYL